MSVPTPLVSAPGASLKDVVPGLGFTYGINGGGVGLTPVSEIRNGAIIAQNLHQSLDQPIQINMTAANIIGMEATPFVLIPAPGAGLSIVVTRVLFRMTATSTAFTGGGTVTIGYASGNAVVNTFAASLITTGTAGTVDTLLVTGASNITLSENAALQITNASAPFAAGTGTAAVIIWYSIV
jgi:hypothetical protein